MDVDRESRKRTRVNASDVGSEKEEEDLNFSNRKIAKRGSAKRSAAKTRAILIDDEDPIFIDDEGAMDAPSSLQSSSKEQASHVPLSNTDADCFIVPSQEDVVRATSRTEVSKKEEVESAVVLKKKRGRKRKIHRKKIGMNELGVHEIEDSEDSEGYDALSAPEMAATAIEYLEEADQIRIRCKNIKGDLSGVMKRRLHNAKEIIRGLARTITKAPVKMSGRDTIEDMDETNLLRMENKELKARLKEEEKNCQKKEKDSDSA